MSVLSWIVEKNTGLIILKLRNLVILSGKGENVVYSLTGLITKAKDENEANEHINTINQVLWHEQSDLYKDTYSAALIFETENLDTFLKEL